MWVEWIYSPDPNKVGQVEEIEDVFEARNLIRDGRVREAEPSQSDPVTVVGWKNAPPDDED